MKIFKLQFFTFSWRVSSYWIAEEPFHRISLLNKTKAEHRANLLDLRATSAENCGGLGEALPKPS